MLRGGTLLGLVVGLLCPLAQAQDALVVHVAQAVARLEGFGPKHTLATRRRNPLNISPRGVVLTYPSLEAGWCAAYLAIDKKLARGLTLHQIVRELGATDPQYAWKLGRLTGLPIDRRLR